MEDMTKIVLSLPNNLDQANSKVLEAIYKLNDNFSKLESELSLSKQVNSLSSSRLVNMECQCLAKTQYLRRKCLDIIGIPSEVKADVLEERFLRSITA